MISRWYLDRNAIESPLASMSRLGDAAFASPYRSTVPLIELAERAPAMLAMIAHRCGADDSCTAHIEYRAENPAGGRTSYTDLMLLGATRALAIEAKWTEPRYETVAARLTRRVGSGEGPGGSGGPPPSNERIVLGWLELLQPYSRVSLTVEGAHGLVYQTLHRAASACSTQRRPALAYLHFGTTDARAADAIQYVADLQALFQFLGSPEDFPISVVHVPVTPTPAFDAISGLRKGRPETDAAVRSALAATPLLAFGTPVFTRIE